MAEDYSPTVSGIGYMLKSALVRLKRFSLAAAGRDIGIRRDVRRRFKRFGSEHAGWNVLTGLLGPDSVVYSFGVGEDVSFDIGLIEAFDLVVHAFDPTPRSIRWVGDQKLPQGFVMHTVGIAPFDGKASFCPPANPKHVSHTMLERASRSQGVIELEVRTLSTIMAGLGHDHLDVLKMDVEGAEYDVIDDIASSSIRPTQILVEFHHRFPEVEIESTRSAVATLRSKGYRLFYVSPRGEEMCFVQESAMG
jgi:FkbM family methyltransferase